MKSVEDDGKDPGIALPDAGRRDLMKMSVGAGAGLAFPSLNALALAGAIGFAGNWFAALVRTRAGRRLESPALIADGDHARVDAYVSLAVIASVAAIVAGAPILDPIIGLGMTAVILRITRESWRTVRGHAHHH